MKPTQMRELRIQNNWTLDYVAKRLGVSNQAVSRIESRQNDPSYKVLCKLEKLFGKPHSYLLEQTAVEDEK